MNGSQWVATLARPSLTPLDTTAIKKSSWVSICRARTFQGKYVSAFRSRAIKGTSVQQTLPPEVQENKQTQKEGLEDKEKPSYEGKWEDVISAGIRRPDSLGPQRNWRRVVLKRLKANRDIVMAVTPKRRDRRRNRRRHAKPVHGAEEWRDGEQE
ncbi:hypothetical protein PFLUV_G00120050 [Perca fluviatilis]|uniref:Uncharacterized protein n=1 Tax=Perca fluviatilis TaxID=8168 RepID=A0A6A5F6Q3_PERFL|nr:hypothetical protein PFLUV_G00120050 [Perca fluviatilis]